MKTALTIGFFDGVHLGHQILLQRLRSHPHATILTFESHPKELFVPPGPELLLPLTEKVALLKKYADQVLVLPFSQEFADMSYDELLSQFDISTLILGENSVFGRFREGDETNIRNYAKVHNFDVDYIPKLIFNREEVSSSRIRQALADGNIILAKQLLGRS